MRLRNASLAAASVTALLVVSACAPATPPAPAQPSEAEMVAAADALDRAFLEAFNKGDVEALGALYWNSPNLVSFGPDGMGMKGWDAVKGAMAETFKAMPGAQIEFTSASNAVHGGVVLGSGTWKITVPGQPMAMEGRYTDVKMPHDGKWVYVMDHASAPLPPMPTK